MTSPANPPAAVDPAVFAPEAVSQETAKINQGLVDFFAEAPPLNVLEPQVVRDAREAGKDWLPPIVRLDNAQQRTIPGPSGEIPLRVFVPERVDGVYLHIHGGGWVLGAADHQDPMLWGIAEKANVAVASVEYRLAPEHPYPAGPDDCEAAAAWLAKNAGSEFGTDSLVIGGESAGGHLSAVTVLRMRDRHGFSGFAGANLVYGAYDMTRTPSQAKGQDAIVLPLAAIEWFYDHFVPADRRQDPDVSPLYADLAGLPPALFTVGTLDSLLDDSMFMYSRWMAAGNRAELAVYPGGTHAFNMLPCEIGRQANERIEAFIRDAVAD